MNNVYTTGQIARVCCVAPRTVSKWIDSGLLKGYRVPGSADRRVRKRDLVDFCEEHGITFSEPGPPLRRPVPSPRVATPPTPAAVVPAPPSVPPPLPRRYVGGRPVKMTVKLSARAHRLLAIGAARAGTTLSALVDALILVRLAGADDGAGAGDAGEGAAALDPLYGEAVEIVWSEGRGSTSLLQRRLGVGYNRAARMIDRMAEEGILGPYREGAPRKVLARASDRPVVGPMPATNGRNSR